MGATLEALHCLQEIELQIADLQRGIDRKALKVKKQQSRIAEVNSDIDAQKDQLRADQMEADRLELESKASEEEINKYRNALNTSKTNKEYSAVLTQLNTFKADNSKLEERAIALLSQIDQKRKEIEALEGERAKEEARLEEFRAGVRAAEEKASGRMNRLKGERDEAAAAVPPKALEMFNRVAGKNEGEAMAMIMRTHPRRQEYACEGCNMSVTIEQVNTILSRDEAVLCSVCGRILYSDSSVSSGA